VSVDARRSAKRGTYLLLALILLPFGAEWARLQFFGPKVLYVNGDIAVADYNARLAMHGQLYVGVYDRFGWHHPGPALSYLFAGFYWVFGSSPRTLYATALLLSIACVAASVLLVQWRAGIAAGRMCAVAGGLFLFYLALSSSAPDSLDVMSIVTSPWNPDVVVAPTLLFMVLAASAIDDAPSMAGMLAVGSFIVSADIGTAPLVGLVSAVVVCLALGRLAYRHWIRRSGGAHGRGEEERAVRPWLRPVLSLVGGVVLLALIWGPPLAQQHNSTDGNLSAIVHFFTNHRNPFTANGLLTTFDYLAKASAGSGGARITFLGWVPHNDAITTLVVICALLVGLAALSPLLPHYLRMLTAVVAVGMVAGAIAGNDIVGITWGYLLEWSLGVAAALGFCVFGALGVLLARYATRVAVPRGRQALGVASLAACAVVAVVMVVQVVNFPKLSSVSEPAVGHATNQAVALLRPSDLPTQVDGDFDSLAATGLYSGVVDALSRRGVDLVIQPIWFNSFGNGWFGLHTRQRTGPSRSTTIIKISSPPGTPVVARAHTTASATVIPNP